MDAKVKGYLVATETGIAYPLSPKITTVGFQGCDLDIHGEGMDDQHAMVEFVEKDCVYRLSDLQSSGGTFINNSPVSGVTVLTPGDKVRFGNSGNYEFVVEQTPQRPPIRTSSRQASPQLQPVIIYQQQPVELQLDGALPVLGAMSTLPPAGSVLSLKNRPNSATLGNSRALAEQPARRSSWSMQPGMTVTSPVPKLAGAVPLVRSPAPLSPLANMTPSKPPSSASLPLSGASSRRSTAFNALELGSVVQEKELRIAELTAEIGRLRAMEMDKAEKDDMVSNFQTQLNDLQGMLNTMRVAAPPGNQEAEQRLRLLEEEVNRRRREVTQVKSTNSSPEHQAARLNSSSSSSRTFLVDEQQIGTQSPTVFRRTNSELEKLRIDSQSTANLATQLQRELSGKESQIAAVAAQNEALKKELRSKELELAAVYTKVSRLKDLSKYEEQMAAREKELVALREKFKTAEARGQDSADKLQETLQELQLRNKQLDESAAKCAQLQAELDASQKQLVESRRAEREQQAELLNARSMQEHLRTRLSQLLCAARMCDTEATDDQLVDATNSLLQQREQAVQALDVEKARLSQSSSERETLLQSVAKLADSVNDCVVRLRSNGLLARHVQQETLLLQAEPVHSDVHAVKHALLAVFSVLSDWASELEKQLEASGLSVNISDSSHAMHVAALHGNMQTLLQDKQLLQAALDESQQRLHEQLASHAAAASEQHQLALHEAVQRERATHDETLQKTVREMHNQAKDERNEMLARFDKEKKQLQDCVDTLRKTLADKTADEQALSLQNAQAAAELNEAADKQAKLLEQMELNRKSAEERNAALQQEIAQHREIENELNERLKKVSKLTEEYELQLHELKKEKKKAEELKRRLNAAEQELNEYKQNRVSPAQFQAAEKTISLLKQENAQLKQSLQEQNSVIESLRHDLKGAHARLSDMKGEIPESHKQELDLSRARIYELEQEVLTLRQELKRISSASDETHQAAKSSVSEVEKLREKVFTLQEKLREKEGSLDKLLEEHTRQSEDSRSKLGLLEEENKMTAELTALGAQCKGERHHQIIARQKEALNELRSRIKVLEQLRPGSKHDTAIHQVVQLKKELAELKASKQSSISRPTLPPQAVQQVQVVESLNAMLTPDAMDLQFEKQAHEATMQALEISESTYLQLGRSMAESLTVEHLEGQKSLAYMPSDERERVAAERERACNLLVSRVKVLKESMSRKDDLVQEHEKLLAKLRQIEEIASKRGAQIDKLLEDLRNKTEECELLRDYMHKTREDTDVAKRKGKQPPGTSTIVSTYAPNDTKIKSMVTQRHERCQSPIENDWDAQETNRRTTERMKRKNYEIHSLKKELGDREKDLSLAKNKISSLQQTMGFASVENSAR